MSKQYLCTIWLDTGVSKCTTDKFLTYMDFLELLRHKNGVFVEFKGVERYATILKVERNINGVKELAYTQQDGVNKELSWH